MADALVSISLPHLHTAPSLSLQRTTSGWALFDDRNRAVFRAEGPNARRRCLAHASAHGVLRLTFGEQQRAA
jgi:hypothetical protein